MNYFTLIAAICLVAFPATAQRWRAQDLVNPNNADGCVQVAADGKTLKSLSTACGNTTGTGTTNVIPKWSGSDSFTDSLISEAAGDVSIDTNVQMNNKNLTDVNRVQIADWGEGIDFWDASVTFSPKAQIYITDESTSGADDYDFVVNATPNSNTGDIHLKTAGSGTTQIIGGTGVGPTGGGVAKFMHAADSVSFIGIDSNEIAAYLTDGGSGSQVGDLYLQNDGGNVKLGNTTEVELRVNGSDFVVMEDGKVGFGGTPDLAPVQIYQGDSGATTASGDLVIEDDGNPVLQFLSPNDKAAIIRFGDPEDVNDGDIEYAHSSGQMRFAAGGSATHQIVVTDGGVGVRKTPDTTIYSLDTEGRIRSERGDSGATYHGYSGVVIEDDHHAGLSILTPSDKAGYIMFGSPTNNARGQIAYDHEGMTYERMRFSTGGSNQMALSPTGLRIGPVSPLLEATELLDVRETSANDPTIKIGCTVADSENCGKVVLSEPGVTEAFSIKYKGDTNKLEIDSSGQDDILVIERESGEIGINDSTPSYTLDVNGSINGSSVLVNGVPVSSSTDTYWTQGSGTGEILYSGGNVGIGPMTSPNRPLTVNQSASTTGFTGVAMTLRDAGNIYFGPNDIDDVAYNILDIGASNWDYRIGVDGGNTNYGKLHLVTGSTQTKRLTIERDGQVGINDSTPNAQFEVYGHTILGDGSTTPVSGGDLSITDADSTTNLSFHGSSGARYAYIEADGTGPNVWTFNNHLSSGSTEFQIAGETSLEILSNGQVLIGDPDFLTRFTKSLGNNSAMLYPDDATQALELRGKSDNYYQLFLDTTGNVGIGANDPKTTLHIEEEADNSYPEVLLYGNDGYQAFVTGQRNAAGSGTQLMNVRAKWGDLTTSTEVAGIRMLSGPDTTNKDDGRLLLMTRGDGDAGIQERARVTSDGRFLVGSGAGNYAFFIDNNLTYPAMRIKGDSDLIAGGWNRAGIYFSNDGAVQPNSFFLGAREDYFQLSMEDVGASGNGSIVRMGEDGYVAIGDSGFSAGERLEVQDGHVEVRNNTNTNVIINPKTSGDPCIRMAIADTNKAFLCVDDDDGDKFKIGLPNDGSPRLTIDPATGNVGIGTSATTPGSLLEVRAGKATEQRIWASSDASTGDPDMKGAWTTYGAKVATDTTKPDYSWSVGVDTTDTGNPPFRIGYTNSDWDEPGDNPHFTILSNGIVGIGGSVGIGLDNEAPESLLHIVESTVANSPHPSAQLTLERDGTNYLQFMTGDTGTSGLLWGDASDYDQAKLYYDHSAGGGAGQFRMAFSGSATFLIDGSNGYTGIGTGGNVPADWLQIGSSVSSRQVFSSWLHEFGNTGGTGITSNVYHDGSDYLLRQADAGSHISLGAGGDIHFRFAPTGAADSVASFTTRVNFDNEGNVGFNYGSGIPPDRVTIGNADLTTSKGSFRIAGNNPGVRLEEEDGSADENWQIESTAGVFKISTNNDAFSSASTKLRVLQDGTVDLMTGDTKLNGVTYTWPASGGSNQQILVNDGSDNLSWATNTGGGGGGGGGASADYLGAKAEISGAVIADYIYFDTSGSTDWVCQPIETSSSVYESNNFSAVDGVPGYFQYDGASPKKFQVTYNGSYYGYQSTYTWSAMVRMQKDGATDPSSYSLAANSSEEADLFSSFTWAYAVFMSPRIDHTFLTELKSGEKFYLELCLRSLTSSASDILVKSFGCNGDCNDTNLTVIAVN